MKFSTIVMLSAATTTATYAFTLSQTSADLLLPIALSISIFHVPPASAFAIPNPHDLRAIMPDMIKRDAAVAASTGNDDGKDDKKDGEHKKKHHHEHTEPSDHSSHDAGIDKRDVATATSHTHTGIHTHTGTHTHAGSHTHTGTHTRTHTHDHLATPKPTLALNQEASESGTHHHKHHHETTTSIDSLAPIPSLHP